MNSRLNPSEPFPNELTSLELSEVEVLNSKVSREIDHEYVHDGEVTPETEFRSEELTEELDRRDDTEDSQAAHPAPVASAASDVTASPG